MHCYGFKTTNEVCLYHKIFAWHLEDQCVFKQGQYIIFFIVLINQWGAKLVHLSTHRNLCWEQTNRRWQLAKFLRAQQALCASKICYNFWHIGQGVRAEFLSLQAAELQLRTVDSVLSSLSSSQQWPKETLDGWRELVLKCRAKR